MAQARLGFLGVAALVALLTPLFMIETVEQGHEAVATRFGKVTGDVLGPGLHVVNPILNWDHFNTLHQTHFFEAIAVPAQDQQAAALDVSVQYRITPGAPLNMRSETGTMAQSEAVHFIPYVRGALRDAGRSTKRVEDFYDEQTVAKYISVAMHDVGEALDGTGFEVADVIVRAVALPPVIVKAIEEKKQREQEVEKERAELERVALQAQQAVKQAEAERAAAEEKAIAIETLARAESEKIRLLQAQLAHSPQYVELVKAERWDGKLPMVTGQAVPLLNFSKGELR